MLTTTIPYTIASELFQIAIRAANTFSSDKQVWLSSSKGSFIGKERKGVIICIIRGLLVSRGSGVRGLHLLQ